MEAVKLSSAEWVAAGNCVEVLCLDAPGSEWLLKFPLSCHAVGPGRGPWVYASGLVPWLKAHAREYDAVIIEGIWQYHAFGAWRVLSQLGVPYVVFTHGMLDPWFKRTFPLKHLKKWLFWPWADYRVLRDASAVLFTCEDEKRLARESFFLYKAREVVVEFGAAGVPVAGHDYAGFFMGKWPQLQAFRRFVFLGRVHPKKGPDIIIRALAQLQSTGVWLPESMRLIMAGPSDGAYAEQLRALATSLGVADSIVWTGMLLGEEKWGALQCAEAFVLPSHQENFGIAVAESLSVGVPVLISQSVNIWTEIVADGAGTAGVDNVEGFAQQLSDWLAMPADKVVEMRAAARSCYEKRYTAKRAAESLMGVLQTVRK